MNRDYGRKVIRMSDVEEIDIRWLWDPYIPYSSITVIHGEADVGKSMLAAKLMGYCTNGQAMVQNQEKMKPCNVLYLTGEKNLAVRVRRRLLESKADLERVYVVNDTLPITLADDSLQTIINDNDIQVVIIDPIQEYLESDEGMQDELSSYPIIKKLANVAKETGCAVILISDSEDMGAGGDFVLDNPYDDCIDSALCLEFESASENENEKRLIHEKCTLEVRGSDISYTMQHGCGLC
jgi:predicted ATP-dependent serine protease